MTPAELGRKLRALGLRAGDTITLEAPNHGTRFTLARHGHQFDATFILEIDRVRYRVIAEAKRAGLEPIVDLDDTHIEITFKEAE